MNTIKTLKLTPPLVPGEGGLGSETAYIVLQVTDSVIPMVGQNISKMDALMYCDHPDWKVTIVKGKG